MTEKRKLTDDQLAALARAALVREGKLLPSTDEELARLEEEIAKDPLPLPTSLRDPDVVLDRPRGRKPQFQPRAHDIGPQKSAGDLLARAAREGGAISPEVEEEMRHQRERHAKKEKPGEAKDE